jgi:carbamoyl-phosphate synthase small subunit
MPEAATPADVCCKDVITYQAQPAQDVENVNGSKAAVTDGKKVVVVDCGVKHSIIRSLINRGAEVIRVPFDYDFTALEYDGVYVSNGPGCPCACEKTIENIKKAFESGKPVFGLGLGYLLVAKAAGCELEKLKRPHRSANQPVRKEGSNRTYITAQNVAATVKPNSIPAEWDAYYVNLNDGAVDGIKHKTKPFAGTQFNPEVCVGLNENVTLIDEFISKL